MFISGCASVSKEQIERDSKAKMFIVSPGKSSIYIFRNGHLNSQLNIALSVDDKNIGISKPSAYLLIEVVPGQHKISCDVNPTEGFILMTHPDHTYFIHQKMVTGFSFVSCAFYEVAITEGKVAVNGCELSD